MSTITVIGKVTDKLGIAEHRSTSWDGRVASEERWYEALPSTSYKSSHPGPLPVRVGHQGRDIGRCIHLERSVGDDITAVCQIDGADDLLTTMPGRVFFSPQLRFRAYDKSDIEISELALTSDPATTAQTPVEMYPGDVHHVADFVRCRHRPSLAAMLDRAEAAHRRRRLCGPIDVEDDPAARKWEEQPNGGWVDGRGAFFPGLHRSESGQYRIIDGHRVELEYSAPYHGGILSVR